MRLLMGALRKLVESVVMLMLNGRKSSATERKILVIWASFRLAAAQLKDCPLFHKVPSTKCPSKSRNITASAPERLLSLGAANETFAMNVIDKAVNMFSTFFMVMDLHAAILKDGIGVYFFKLVLVKIVFLEQKTVLANIQQTSAEIDCVVF